MNICPNCGGDIDVLKEMFPDGWTTCEELERRKTMKETKFRAMAGGVMVYFDLFTIAKAWDDDSFQCKNHLTVSRNSTLMQYVGRKGSNGEEVYEGDILGGIIGGGFVYWDERETRFGIKFPLFPEETREIMFEELAQKDIEVIGNIYENPELLEAGNGS